MTLRQTLATYLVLPYSVAHAEFMIGALGKFGRHIHERSTLYAAAQDAVKEFHARQA